MTKPIPPVTTVTRATTSGPEEGGERRSEVVVHLVAAQPKPGGFLGSLPALCGRSPSDGWDSHAPSSLRTCARCQRKADAMLIAGRPRTSASLEARIDTLLPAARAVLDMAAMRDGSADHHMRAVLTAALAGAAPALIGAMGQFLQLNGPQVNLDGRGPSALPGVAEARESLPQDDAELAVLMARQLGDQVNDAFKVDLAKLLVAAMPSQLAAQELEMTAIWHPAS